MHGVPLHAGPRHPHHSPVQHDVDRPQDRRRGQTLLCLEDRPGLHDYMVVHWYRHDFSWSAAVDLGEPPAGVKPMAEDALAADMTAFIKQSPRAWKEILQKYHGQPYRTIYRAFSSLRHNLGRAGDSPWFRYTFSDRDFAFDSEPTKRQSNFDPRHR